jgi:2-(1,2-epoxy-1,2-dihydrophenyl)acetyl-CoA isomerase
LPRPADFQELRYEVNKVSHVATVTLDRPKRANAINSRLFMEIIAACAEASIDEDVWIVIWTGAGNNFCSGADFSGEEGAGTPTDPRAAWTPVYRGGFEATTNSATWVATLGETLYSMEKPMVCAINGAAAGAGLAISLCCDVRIGSPEAKFMTAFTSVNLPPEAGLSFLLSRVVGLGHAMDIFLTGRQVGAEEALRIGLLSRVVPSRDSLLSAAREVAAAMTWLPQPAVRVAKVAVRRGLEITFHESLRSETNLGHKARGPEDKYATMRLGKDSKMARIRQESPKPAA